ncbi:MAG TPA: hypothetical protein VIY27_07420 [Myxococcota bacterium]
MERTDGPQTPFEVYCFNCRVTFPVGTRRCVHCGGPIGRRGPTLGTQLPMELPAAEEDVPVEFSLGRRLGGLSLWALVALGAVLSRMCSG